MANTTPEYWSYAGVSLQTLAYNIDTIGGDRNGVPPVRGSNLTIPFKDGDVFMPKTADARVITLGMWVVGANTDGKLTTKDSEEEFDRNWARLRKLFWGNPKKQFPLSKTVSYWKADGTRVKVRVTAMAAFAGGLSPVMNGRNRGRFTVDLLLSDPWFYPDVPFTKTGMAAGSSWTLPAEQMGDAPTNHIRVFYRGVGMAPAVKLAANSEYPNSGGYMRFIPTMGGATMGNNIEIYVKNAYVYDRQRSRYPSATIQHFGSPSWLELGTLDDQVLTLETYTETTTVVADLTIWPRYF